MFVFTCITAALLLIYGLLIHYYKKAWRNIKNFNGAEPASQKPQVRITVIIPARNEEENIVNCLKSILLQSYPKELTEVIVVNDHSTDRTEEMVKQFHQPQIKLINLKDHVKEGAINSYKKKAIEIAISLSCGDLIVTTDADCTSTPYWLSCLALCHQRYNAAFIAAPVKITAGRSLLSIFQAIDFLTLQGITGASVSKKIHSMCNGANLAYEKKAFYAVGGFKDIDNIASGDDMLLMHKIVTSFPDRFFFLKHPGAIVTTLPAASWKAFINQRIRWASKADKYNDKSILAVLLLVYFANLCLLVLLIAGFFNITWFFFFLLLVLFKTLLEYPFVRLVAEFFDQQSLMPYFPFFQPLHIFYTVVAGWLGKFGSYEWKSRKVK